MAKLLFGVVVDQDVRQYKFELDGAPLWTVPDVIHIAKTIRNNLFTAVCL